MGKGQQFDLTESVIEVMGSSNGRHGAHHKYYTIRVFYVPLHIQVEECPSSTVQFVQRVLHTEPIQQDCVFFSIAFLETRGQHKRQEHSSN